MVSTPSGAAARLELWARGLPWCYFQADRFEWLTHWPRLRGRLGVRPKLSRLSASPTAEAVATTESMSARSSRVFRFTAASPRPENRAALYAGTDLVPAGVNLAGPVRTGPRGTAERNGTFRTVTVSGDGITSH